MSMQHLGKLILVMFVVNLVLFYLGSIDSNLNIGKAAVDQMFNTGEGGLQETSTGAVGRVEVGLNSTEINPDTQDFSISAWGIIKEVFNNVFRFLFAPVNLLTQLGVPIQVTVIVGVAWAVGYLFTLLGVFWRY